MTVKHVTCAIYAAALAIATVSLAGCSAAPVDTRGDEATGDAAEYMLRAKKPDLMLVYYTDLDNAQHEWGAFSTQAYDALEKIDGQVGRLVVATRTDVLTTPVPAHARLEGAMHLRGLRGDETRQPRDCQRAAPELRPCAAFCAAELSAFVPEARRH